MMVVELVVVYKDRGVSVGVAAVAWWLSDNGSADLIVEWWFGYLVL